MAQVILDPIQSAPGAASLTTAGTVPTDKAWVISTYNVCNRGAATTFRVAISPAGAAISNEHYLNYDTAIGANETLPFTVGATAKEGTILRVYNTLATCSFNFFVIENDQT